METLQEKLENKNGLGIGKYNDEDSILRILNSYHTRAIRDFCNDTTKENRIVLNIFEADVSTQNKLLDVLLRKERGKIT